MIKSTTQQSTLTESLRCGVRGEVLSDPVSLGIYATDASMYQMIPLAVVVAKDRRDVVETVRICSTHGVSILPRAGGTSLTGQTVNRGVVIDVSKYMNQLLEVNPDEQWARVQPGLVRDELNEQLHEHRLHFAPDPATSNRANIGGMIACNAAGMRSLQYGMTIDHILEVEVVLPTGEELTLKELSDEEWQKKCNQPDREGEVYRECTRIIRANEQQIKDRFPKVPRRSGGYSFDAFTDGKPWNLAKLMAASEGTLAFVVEAKVHLEPVPRHSGLLLAHFATIGECLRAVEPIVSHAPSSVELLDGVVLRQAKKSRASAEACRMVEGDPEGLLIVEARSDDPDLVVRKLEAIRKDLQQRQTATALPLFLDAERVQDIWLMRANALGLMTTVPGARKPTPYIEDAAVPLSTLPEYIEEVLAICKKHGQPVSLFAHAGVGLLHIRPLHDLHDPEDREQMKIIQREVFDTVRRYQGAWSGEHGDGIVRGGFNKEYFGDELYEAFRQMKAVFDPAGILNPGKIVDTPPMDSNLRFHQEYKPVHPDTLYQYRDFPNMMAAVEICTGVGACRKTISGTMCPSYMATREEAHSTRGRANALRLALSGQLGQEGLAHEGVHDVLDLCLSCKGCKGECPNNVDVARLKSETLQARHDAYGVSFRDRFIGGSTAAAERFSGPLAGMVNRISAIPPVRWAMEKILGFDRRRPLPEFTREPFDKWFDHHPPAHPHGPEVVLYSDAYMAYYLPEIGKAAVKVLEAAGYRVILERPADSQRTKISRGLLRDAKKDGTRLFEALKVYTDKGLPIICCEPSCWSSLKDDLPDLIEDEGLALSVSHQVYMIDRFLEEKLAAEDISLPLTSLGAGTHILVHGHCHQKALEGPMSTLKLLRRIPEVLVRDSGAGCCGMAGAFGYEKAHYDISVKVAEQRLLPVLDKRTPGTRVVTNGFSCRHQIHDLANVESCHAIELLAESINLEKD